MFRTRTQTGVLLSLVLSLAASAYASAPGGGSGATDGSSVATDGGGEGTDSGTDASQPIGEPSAVPGSPPPATAADLLKGAGQLFCPREIFNPEARSLPAALVPLISQGAMIVAAGEPVSALDLGAQKLVVRLDAALASHDPREARKVLVGVHRPFTGEPVVETMEVFWILAESSLLRMDLAERRLALLAQLAILHRHLAPKLYALAQEEFEEFQKAEVDFALRADYYATLRDHLRMLRQAPIGSVVDNFLQYLGARDSRFRDTVGPADAVFDQKLAEIGIPAADREPGLYSQIVQASGILPSQAGVDVPSINVPTIRAMTMMESPTEPSFVDVLQISEVLKRMQTGWLPVMRDSAAERRQVAHVLARALMDPNFTKMAFFVIEHIPVMSTLVRLPGYQKVKTVLMYRNLDHALNDLYAYQITRINRDPVMTIDDKIREIRKLRVKNPDLDPFSAVARYDTTQDLWAAIVAYINVPANEGPFGDVATLIKNLETQRQAGQLRPLSMTDGPSVINRGIEVATYGSLAIAIVLNQGVPMVAHFLATHHIVLTP